jgi:adenosyl cobinamide kinase/adenosyl cobinamide phosphate guanylyltransferase
MQMSSETKTVRKHLTVEEKRALGCWIREHRDRLEAEWPTRNTDDITAEACATLGFTVSKWVLMDHCLSNGLPIKAESKREAKATKQAIARKDEIEYSTRFWLQVVSEVLVRVTDGLGIDNGELKKFL